MAKIIDNPKFMSLVLTKKTSANKSNENLGYGTLTTGDEVTFGALVNGIEIPQGLFLNAKWTIIGNVQMYKSIVYTVEDGETADVDLESYPLDGFILPKTPDPSQIFQISLTGQVWTLPSPNSMPFWTLYLLGPGTHHNLPQRCMGRKSQCSQTRKTRATRNQRHSLE
jgi:hypothetical protein